MPVRDFIQDVLNGESNVPANCERQYIITEKHFLQYYTISKKIYTLHLTQDLGIEARTLLLGLPHHRTGTGRWNQDKDRQG